MPEAIRVIGIGSPVEGDEVGMQLVQTLSRDPAWQGHDEIEWLVLERPGVGLLPYLEDVATVCLVDALDSPQHQGVQRIELDTLLNNTAALSSHHLGVAEVLQLASALQQLPPRLLIYGIADSQDCYASLSTMLSSDLGMGSAA